MPWTSSSDHRGGKDLLSSGLDFINVTVTQFVSFKEQKRFLNLTRQTEVVFGVQSPENYK